MQQFQFKTGSLAGYYFEAQLLHHEISPYQDIKIINSSIMGNMLLLNDCVMVAQKDEYQYHELITHPNCILLKQFNQALIIGGGDGLCARELLKYPFKKITLVEIDKKVSDVAKKYFSTELNNVFENKRFEPIYQDALTYLPNIDPYLIEENKKFDFIALDLTDPTEEFEHANPLFNGEYYKTCKNYLNKNGVLVVQIGCPYTLEDSFIYNLKQLSKLFKYVCIYGMYMRCYGTYQYFASASDTINLNQNITADNITLPINYEQLKLYNINLHSSMFTLNNEIKTLLNNHHINLNKE